MLEIMLFLVLGLMAGAAFGLLPGIHPNTVVLLVPILSLLGIPLLQLLAFVVSMSVANAVLSFVPSFLLGAPESGSEMAVLPGHRMLLEGHGYGAVKLAAVGSLGAVVLVILMMPLLVFSVPFIYGLLRPHIHILLLAFAALIVLSEKTAGKRVLAALVFLFSGALGAVSLDLPLDSVLLLFPILSGFFGVSMLVLQMGRKSAIPKQKKKEVYVSRSTVNSSVLKGSLGGVLSGFLPGVGSSQIAAVMSREKDEKAFIVMVGAVSVSNILLSIISLWLIGRPRSGAAVVIDQLFTIGFNEVLFIISVAAAAAGFSVVLALFAAKKLLMFLEKLNYAACSCAVVAFLVLLTLLFAGVLGLLLLGTTTAFGVFVNLAGVRRGAMMGVLMLPTILFYAGL